MLRLARSLLATPAASAAARSVAASRRGFFESLPQAPEDPILGLTLAFNADKDPRKISLGVGAYRDDNGKPFVLQCVREAENLIHKKAYNHEYLPIVGLQEFNNESAKLIFGANSPLFSSKKRSHVTIQALSGTGALRVAGDFLARFMPNTPIYVPDPTWANHHNIFRDAGIAIKKYRYYNPKTRGLDFDGLLQDIESAPAGILLLHACAHNPTGVDPTPEQWDQISKIAKAKGHFVLFDCAYQGFASGDCDRDAFAVRHFVEQGHQVAVCQSFAKNFGLYSSRTGAVSFVCSDPDKLESQLKVLVRPMYSNPPVQGARIISTVLADPALNKLWLGEVKQMADRIISMRHALVNGLKAAGSTHNWSHITNQIGMFTYTGLDTPQVERLRDEYHIYMTRDGRASVAGITSANVGYLSEAMHAVSK